MLFVSRAPAWVVGTLLAGTAAAALCSPPAPSAGAVPARAQALLARHCLACHAGSAQSGGLRLDQRAALLRGGRRGPAVVLGQPEKSLLLRAVRHEGALRMPPAGRLSAAEVGLLATWISAGAAYPAGGVPPAHRSTAPLPTPAASGTATGAATERSAGLWSLRPVIPPPLPAVRRRTWARTPVDTFVLAEIERRGLAPAPEADRRTLLRRVSLDLTGLPPEPHEVDAFAADRAPDAYERAVDRLLASPAYGERLALLWLDLARYADSDGYHDDTDRTMWAYRDYVIRSFNADKPFDRFTIEQLAGDLLPNATQEQRIASAFNRCGPTSSEGGAVPEEYLAKYAVDRVNTTVSVWQGLTIQCAECHDHKYDPLTTRDYYRLFAFFNQVPEQALYRGADAPPTLLVPTPEQEARLAKHDRRIGALEADLKACAPAGDRRKELEKQLAAARDTRAAVEKQCRLRIMADVPERRPTHILVRGDYRTRGEEVQPGVPAAIGALPAGARSNRLALANWLVDPHNPLTARVAVNRFWELLFGRGLVRSSDDFGTRGEPPTHPGLLDYLAHGFATGDYRPHASAPAWSVRSLLRLLVTSAVYRQASGPAQRAQDPENHWLARGPRVRLSAELVRDNALAISGLLDRRRPPGGPSVKPYQPGDLWRELASGDQAAKSYVQDHGPDLYRRGLYIFWKRSVLYPSLAVFDAPKREVCVLRRPVTNTPLQAFVTLNDPAYVEAARVFAQRVLEEGGPVLESRLRYAYRRALARAPLPREREVLTGLFHRAVAHYRQDPEAARRLTTVGEWPAAKGLDLAEHAAWTAVCSALLNLDETITRE